MKNSCTFAALIKNLLRSVANFCGTYAEIVQNIGRAYAELVQNFERLQNLCWTFAGLMPQLLQNFCKTYTELLPISCRNSTEFWGNFFRTYRGPLQTSCRTSAKDVLKCPSTFAEFLHADFQNVCRKYEAHAELTQNLAEFTQNLCVASVSRFCFVHFDKGSMVPGGFNFEESQD